METKRLDGLDALRGIAALCVLAFHAWPLLAVNGYLAVDLFFMLSGYVMARSFETRMAAGMGVRAFLWLRFWRLWPTMLVGGLLCLPIFMVDHGTAFLPIALANLLLIPIPILGQVFLLNGPAWSIFFELVANALHAAWLWRLAAIRLVLLAAAMGVTLALFALMRENSLEVGMRPESFLAGIPRLLMPYAIGIVLFRWWQDRPTVAIPGWIGLAMLPAYVAFSGWQGGARWSLDLAFVAMACPLAMAAALRMDRVPRSLVWLGMISFPLYALHTAVLESAAALGLPVIVSFCAAILVAALFHQSAIAWQAQVKRRPAVSTMS